MVITLVGSVMLFLLSLSTNVQAADPDLLDIPSPSHHNADIEQENSPLLGKSYDTKYHSHLFEQQYHRPSLQQPYHLQEEQPQQQALIMMETANSLVHPPYSYKPYSLFGEQLSHISEEDASMLQRMATTTNNSVSIINNNNNKSLPRPISCNVSTYSLRHQHHPLQHQPSFQQIHTTNTATTPTTTASAVSILPDYEDTAYYIPICSNTTNTSTTTTNTNYTPVPSQQNDDLLFLDGVDDNNDEDEDDDDDTVSLPPSFELARLPFPPTVSPMIVLSLLLGYSTNTTTTTTASSKRRPHPQLQHTLQHTSIDDCFNYQQQSHPMNNNTNVQHHYYHLHLPSTTTKWITRSFIGSNLCLGIATGLTRSLLFYYLHIVLEFPMHLLGIIGFLTVIADLLASHFVIMMFNQRLHLSVIVGCIHICLILCTLTYTWLQPALLSSQIIVLCLHFSQSLAFNVIWLLSAHQVDTVILADHTRLLLKGGMAAAYSSLGPVIGLLLVGYFASANENALEGYSLVYQYAAGFTVISAILSWEWSTNE
ncbi:hypothetical protein BDF20DRAFT_349682 [Mycotypha africana]|uniref:uncharacterized protein n=1 Tax=Mycotypha africana TaxID=64632 RepID=UPI00230068E2|nr:uncharacterized protein BDF20DRAFT_349682 [Mycotypha africana]KAI8966922.1 hypothetical protein BDF20DRAFT_349682 [Mycotypha africana]